MIIKVEAIIREEKLQDVLDALGEMEVHGLTCYQVMGCGTQRGMKSYVRAAENQTGSIGFVGRMGKENDGNDSKSSIYWKHWGRKNFQL